VHHAGELPERGRRAVAAEERGHLGPCLFRRGARGEAAERVLRHVGQRRRRTAARTAAHISVPRGQSRPGGITPTTVAVASSSTYVRRRPTTSRAPPKRSRQARWLSTDHGRGAGRVVLGPERAPEHGRGAEHREVVARDERAAQAGDLAGRARRGAVGPPAADGRAVGPHGLGHGALVAEEGHPREGARVAGERARVLQAEGDVVHAPVGRAAGQHDHPVLVGHGQPAQEDRVRDGEHRGREPDAEGEGEHGGPGEARLAAERAGAQAEVGQQSKHAGLSDRGIGRRRATADAGTRAPAPTEKRGPRRRRVRGRSPAPRVRRLRPAERGRTVAP
jgi:hypothetical protein